MTEKRFYLDENGINDREYEFGILGEDELVDSINGIVDENEQLKKEIIEVEKAKDYFYDKVFQLIDIRMKHYENPPMSAPVSNPLSVNYDTETDRLARLSELKALKKELE